MELNTVETTNSNGLACSDTVYVWHFCKRVAFRRSTKEQFPLVCQRWSNVCPAIFWADCSQCQVGFDTDVSVTILDASTSVITLCFDIMLTVTPINP